MVPMRADAPQGAAPSSRALSRSDGRRQRSDRAGMWRWRWASESPNATSSPSVARGCTLSTSSAAPARRAARNRWRTTRLGMARAAAQSWPSRVGARGGSTGSGADRCGRAGAASGRWRNCRACSSRRAGAANASSAEARRCCHHRTNPPPPPPLVYHEGQAACCGPSCNSRDFIGVARLARWDADRPARCCSPTTLCSGVPACSDATRSGRMSHGVGTGGTLGVGLGCTSGFASAHISEPAVVRVAETRRVRCSAAHSRHVLHSACDLSDMSVDVPRAGVLGERRNFRGKQTAIGRSRVCRAEIRRGARSGVALSSCPHRDSIRGIAFPRPQMAVSDMGLDKAEHLLGLCAGRVGADVACAVEGVHE